MAELRVALETIMALSSAMAELHVRIRAREDERRSSSSDRSKGMSAARKVRAQEFGDDAIVADMGSAPSSAQADADGVATLSGVSMHDLTALLASRQQLLSYATTLRARGPSADEYARFAARCAVLIRDASEYAASVWTKQIIAVRSQGMEAMSRIDTRPMAAPPDKAVAATSVLDPVSVVDDDGIDDGIDDDDDVDLMGV
jgi:hypothetical protein